MIFENFGKYEKNLVVVCEFGMETHGKDWQTLISELCFPKPKETAATQINEMLSILRKARLKDKEMRILMLCEKQHGKIAQYADSVTVDWITPAKPQLSRS